ncbi:MAG: ribonuclease D [Arenicella sp.]
MKLDKKLITDQSDLQKVCEAAALEPAIGIDTEFLREKTYYAKLCLVQIAVGDQAYCIDVLALDDLSALADILTNTGVVKVFHSCRQDFEVIYQQLGCLPTPVFDTQLAAAFCGNDAQVGYANILQQEYGVELDKSQTRTDWSRRPLKAQQIDYAVNDVVYLVQLYKDFQKRLQENGRLDWFNEETQQFYAIEDYAADPDLAYQRLNGSSLLPANQHFLSSLAAWRDQLAQKKNIPRTWILKDKELYELADLMPQSEAVLQRSKLNSIPFMRKNSQQIVQRAVEFASKDNLRRIWQIYQPFDAEQKSICQSLMKQVSSFAQQHSVAQAVLATRKDVEAFVRDVNSSRISQGWRGQLLMPSLASLLE